MITALSNSTLETSSKQTSEHTFNSSDAGSESVLRSAVSQLIICRRKHVNLLLCLAKGAHKKTIRCAAMLLDYFGHWQQWKIKAQRTPWVYQPIKNIYEDLMEVFSKHVIRHAIALLVEVGLLERRANPSNWQDKTWQYNLLFDRVNSLAAETSQNQRFVNPEHREFSPEHREFNVEQHHSFQSINVLSTSLSCEREELDFGKEEAGSCDIVELELPNPSGVRIEVKESQEQEDSGKGKSSAPSYVKLSSEESKNVNLKCCELKGFKSQAERDGFYQALLDLGKHKSGVRSVAGWANAIIKSINAGEPCEYLNEYRRDESSVGTCEGREWEVVPGKPYPRFISYLKRRMMTRGMSPEQAIDAAHKALRDINEAGELWESFKRTAVNFKSDWEKQKAMGVSSAYVPPELMIEAEVVIEDAAKALHQLDSGSAQVQALGCARVDDSLPALEPSAQTNQADDEPELSLPEKVSKWREMWNGKGGRFIRSMMTRWIEQTPGVILTPEGPALEADVQAEHEKEVESQPSPEPSPPKLPPVGWWVEVEGELAQVKQHYPHGAYIEGDRRRGGRICGVYPDMVPLTQEEMLKRGLRWTKV